MAAPHLLTDTSDLAARKAALRRLMKQVRAAQDPALGAALQAHVLDDLVIPPGAIVAGVWPLPGEIDLRPLWHALHARGGAVVLPETTQRGQALRFRRWVPGCAMRPEAFGTVCPEGELAIPDIIFVPLLAFDRRGHRLGYGGGYYDRTLAANPAARAVGFGFAAQEVPEVPAGPHDVPLGRIVTEGGAISLGKAKEDVLF